LLYNKNQMNLYSVFSFTASAIVLYLGTKTLQKDHKNKLNIIFSLFCLSMFFHTFFFGIVYSLKTKEFVTFIMNFTFIGIHTFLPLLFHFYLVITKTKIKSWILVLNYLPPCIFIPLNFMGISLFSEYIKSGDAWTGILNVNLYFFYLLHIVVFITIGSILIYKWGHRTNSNKEKIYARYLLVTSISIYIIGQSFALILPLFKIYNYQFIAIILLSLYIIGLYFLVSNYRFMNLNYSLLADEILSNINDMVLILDPDLKIINVNNKFKEFTAASDESDYNKNFFDLIIKNENFQSKINEILELKLNHFYLRINYKNGNEYVSTNSYISGIKDKFNDLTGFLVVSTEIKEIIQFQKYFKITDRELEVIESIISGLTYKETSIKLNITEKTIESHLTNIYNKLNIKNKIELVKIAAGFNIKPDFMTN
jgi:DNA-binding CsgD family transcriptional regulator/PAS domain-containing protein